MSSPAIALCTACRKNHTAEGICVLCLGSESPPLLSLDRSAGTGPLTNRESSYTQAQAQAQVKDQAQDFHSLRPPEPGCNDDGPELRRLMELHREGTLEPVDVKLGKLPPHAGMVMHNIADHVQLLMGLRRAVGDDRALPYARSMAVKAGLAENVGTASNAINALVRAGVVNHVGSLPPLRPGIDGTKLYTPPGEMS